MITLCTVFKTGMFTISLLTQGIINHCLPKHFVNTYISPEKLPSGARGLWVDPKSLNSCGGTRNLGWHFSAPLSNGVHRSHCSRHLDTETLTSCTGLQTRTLNDCSFLFSTASIFQLRHKNTRQLQCCAALQDSDFSPQLRALMRRLSNTLSSELLHTMTST